MSTAGAGRGKSLSSPMSADDIAGVSYLYPRGNFSQSTGSIAGRITFPDGRGVHLASVVTIRPTGAALSALTDPEGRFRIAGVPPDQYLIFAHPLPPTPLEGATGAVVALRAGPDGRPIASDQ